MIMITFTQTEFLWYIIIIVFIFIAIFGDRSYWKAKYETLDNERNSGEGWREEARFLRRLVNKDAAEEVEY